MACSIPFPSMSLLGALIATIAVVVFQDVAIQSCLSAAIQICVLVTPVIIMAGFVSGHHLSLRFRSFDSALAIMAVVVAKFSMGNTRIVWLLGLCRVVGLVLPCPCVN